MFASFWEASWPLIYLLSGPLHAKSFKNPKLQGSKSNVFAVVYILRSYGSNTCSIRGLEIIYFKGRGAEWSA